MDASDQAKTKLKDLPISRVIPNMLTMAAAASGITSIRLSAQGRWDYAVIAIILAAILDGLDGRVARMLETESKLGAELDSLSDFVCFGVAPAMLMYFWSMHQVLGLGWIVALMYAMCCVFRLARFNTMLEEEPLPYWGNFFTGLPAPGGALVVLMPMMFFLHLTGNEGEEYARWMNIFASPITCGLFLFFAGFLMASRIPTMSLKKMRVPVKYLLPCLFFVVIFAGLTISHFWLTLGIISAGYVVSVPLSIIAFLRARRKYGNGRKAGL